jgi:hypothetical protein
LTAPSDTPAYEWDRTGAEKAEQARARIIQQTPFPTPPARTVRKDAFFEYWNELIKLDVGRYARLFCHRWYPVLLPAENENPLAIKKEMFPSEKRYDASDGPLNEQRIMETVGVGDYTFRLNDTRAKTFSAATILFCEKFATMRDFDTYPPKLDVDRVDWTDPANAQYIKWGRSTGVLRDPEAVAEEKEQMAAATVTTELIGQANKERERADQLLNAQLDQTKAELAETKTQLERAKQEKSMPAPAAPASSQASDLISVVSSVAALSKELVPRPDNSFQNFLDLEKEREITRREQAAEERRRAQEEADRQRARADDLQAQLLRDAKEARTAPPAAAAAAPLTAVQVLQEEVSKQELIQTLYGGKRRPAANEEEPAQESSADKWAAILTPLAPIIGQTISGLFSLAAHGLNVWGEAKYNEAVKAKGGEPQLPSHVKKNQKPGEPLPPTPAANPAADAQQKAFGQVMGQVIKLVKPIQRALEAGTSGAQFADDIINSAFTAGRADYDRIREIAATLTTIGMQVEGEGLEQFKNAVATCLLQIKNNGVPEVWNELRSVPTFVQFLEDFYNYDEWKAAEEQAQQEAN